MLMHEKHGKDSDVLQMISAFFKRIVFDLKQPWIFFQLESLSVFHTFLMRNTSNNSLMTLQQKGGSSFAEKRLAHAENMMKDTLTKIVTKFVEL